MDMKALYERGLKLRTRIFGEKAVQARMSAQGEFGRPLQDLINTYAYGDVWSRTGLDDRTRSIAVLAMTAALNRPHEFKVHVKGALANGCTPEEIREIALLVGIYCGIPAANDAHRLALEAMDGRT
jgi:4-carboxymuconolactone decarboxylase